MPEDTLESFGILVDPSAGNPRPIELPEQKELVQSPINPTWAGRKRLIGDAFTNVEELLNQAPGLDKAVFVPLHYEYPEGELEPLYNHKGVLNLGTMQVASVVRGRYTILNHDEAIAILCDALGEFKTEVIGKVKNYRNSVCVDLCFPQISIDTNAGRLLLGSRIVNSYDYSNTFNGFAYCYHGSVPMNVSRLIGEARFSARHTRHIRENSIARILIYLYNIREAGSVLAGAINYACNSDIVFEDQEKFWYTIYRLLGSKRATHDVMKNYFGDFVEVPNPVVRRWTLFSKLSDYVHRSMNMSENATMEIGGNIISILNRDFTGFGVPDDN